MTAMYDVQTCDIENDTVRIHNDNSTQDNGTVRRYYIGNVSMK